MALTIWPYFGPERETAEPSSPDNDVTSTLPNNVFFRGQDFPVRFWTDVLVTTLEALIRVGLDDFQRVMAELPRVVNADPGTFRKARRLRRLSNGAFMETNFSAASIHRLCLQALEVVGVGAGEWRVDYVSLRPDDDIGEDGADTPSQLKQLQLEFWAKTREALLATGKFASLRSPSAHQWFNIRVGRSGFWISLTMSATNREIAVKFMMNDDVAAAIEVFRQEQAAIEHEVGAGPRMEPSSRQEAKEHQAAQVDQRWRARDLARGDRVAHEVRCCDEGRIRTADCAARSLIGASELGNRDDGAEPGRLADGT